MYIGDIAEDQILDFYFGTTDTFTGPALAVYKGNSLTEEAVAGITLDVDFDGITGLNHVRIDTSASAFYEVANDYAVVITAGTVLGQSQVGTVLREFSIESRSAALASVATEARLAELDAGNLPAVADTIAADVVNLDGAAMRGTDNAALASVATEARLAELDAANLPADVDAIVATVVAILADTGELQTDWADGGRLDLLVDAIKAKTDNQPGGVQKNSALANFEFLMVDVTDGRTPKTGLTITAQRSLDGAAFAACANAATELGSGVYVIDLDASDLNGDVITFRFTATGADPTLLTIKTNP